MLPFNIAEAPETEAIVLDNKPAVILSAQISVKPLSLKKLLKLAIRVPEIMVSDFVLRYDFYG